MTLGKYTDAIAAPRNRGCSPDSLPAGLPVDHDVLRPIKHEADQGHLADFLLGDEAHLAWRILDDGEDVEKTLMIRHRDVLGNTLKVFEPPDLNLDRT